LIHDKKSKKLNPVYWQRGRFCLQILVSLYQMIALQKGRFLEYSLRNHTQLLLREHTQVLPSLVLLRLPPDISRFLSFPLLLKNENCGLSIFVFQNASKRLVFAFFPFFPRFFAPKHSSPFYIFAVTHWSSIP